MPWAQSDGERAPRRFLWSDASGQRESRLCTVDRSTGQGVDAGCDNGAVTEELDPATLAFAHQVFDHARNGDSDQLADYIDAGLPVDLTNDKGDTLLILAAYNNQVETLTMLLDKGADHGRLNDRGQTALGSAVFRQSAAGVETLLTRGADPALGSPSAIEVARFFDLPEMLALLESGRH